MSAIWRKLAKLAALFPLLLIPFAAAAQTDAIQGHCDLGGTKALLSGMSSTNYNQGDIPGCTVTVYLTGTTTLATIYSNATGTPLANPFTAVLAGSPNPGYWIFWAATGVGYDVKMSGGGGNPACSTAPLCYVIPLTYTDLKVGGGGGGGGGVTNVSCDPAMGNLLGCTVSNPGTTPAFHWNLNTQGANTIYGNFTNSTATPFFGHYVCTGLFTCTYDSGSNTITFNVPTASSLSITSLDPILINGGHGPVSSGTAQVTCPTCNNQAIIDMNINPPAPGNYVRLHPTNSVISGPGYCAANNVPPPGNGVTFPGYFGLFTGGTCTNTTSQWADDNGNLWPLSYINPANVTTVYAVSINSFLPGSRVPPGGSAFAGTPSLVCAGANVLNTNRVAQQINAATSLVGSTIGAATCVAQIVQNSSILTSISTSVLNAPAVYLYVYSTDAPLPYNALFNVGPYLNYDINAKLLTTATDFPNWVFATNNAALTLPSWPYNANLTMILDYAGTGVGACSGGGTTSALATYNNATQSWICTPITMLGGGGGGGTWFTEIFTCSGTSGTLAHTPSTLTYVTDNGLMLAAGTDYTQSGTTITFASAVAPGDTCYAGYYY